MGKKSKLKAQRRAKAVADMQIKRDLALLGSKRGFYDEIRQSQSGEMGFLKRQEAVVINAQDVAAYVDKQQAVWGDLPFDELANISPPFEKTFVEYVTVLENEITKHGVAFDLHQLSNGDYEGHIGIYNRDSLFEYLLVDVHPVKFSPINPFSFWDRKFEITHTADEDGYSAFWEAENYESHAALCVALWAFNLLNSRTAETVDDEPDAELSRLHEKHYGTPITKYKVLRIKPTGKCSNDNEPKEYQGIMPEHLRRGHWRHVENHPIAHFNGTRWIRDTVVGDKKNGVVVKDYKVEPPANASEGA